jgi:hypothetical protein
MGEPGPAGGRFCAAFADHRVQPMRRQLELRSEQRFARIVPDGDDFI